MIAEHSIWGDVYATYPCIRPEVGNPGQDHVDAAELVNWPTTFYIEAVDFHESVDFAHQVDTTVLLSGAAPGLEAFKHDFLDGEPE